MVAAPAKRDTYVLGLGSNLGDRLATLRAAVSALSALDEVEIVARSAVYRTPPVGPAQPDFYNAAVRVAVRFGPEALLDRALDVERALGRRRPDPVRWGPRIIDIDVLWCATGALRGPRLEVPHPELTRRAFALRPLLDVAPDAADPHTGRPYHELDVARARLRVITSSL